jgi:hypothetical protein
MEVATGSDAVRDARRVALELLLSDHAGECVAPCSARWPAGLDIPGFVREIVTGDVSRSMRIITERLALPGALGRICPRLCEQGCRRTEYDEGLTIGPLHRYTADLDRHAAAPYVPPRAPGSGKSVAIVGAARPGCGGYFLLQKDTRARFRLRSRAGRHALWYTGLPSSRTHWTPRSAIGAWAPSSDELRWGGTSLASLRSRRCGLRGHRRATGPGVALRR